jgi:hypothetical protein
MTRNFFRCCCDRETKGAKINGACSMHGTSDKFRPKPEGDLLFERPRRRKKNDIKLDITEVSWNHVDLVYLKNAFF